MTALLLAENASDLNQAREFAGRRGLADPLFYPVSTRDPFFFDAFEHECLRRWSNTEEFLHIRHYDWIYKFRENQSRIAALTGQVPASYRNALDFFLAYGFGTDYRVFSDYLGVFCERLGVDAVYLRDLSAPYAACLRRLRPANGPWMQNYAN